MADNTKERANRIGNNLPKHHNNSAVQGSDWFKLFIAVLCVAGAIWLYYAPLELSFYVKLIFPVVGIVLALWIVFYWCNFGKRLVRYVRESVAEFKKVVWPPKKDAIRMTIFVVIFVAVLSLFIYAVDSLISWLFFDLLLKKG